MNLGTLLNNFIISFEYIPRCENAGSKTKPIISRLLNMKHF